MNELCGREPLLTASEMHAHAARFTDAYHVAIAPLCAAAQLPAAAVDILLFLANNPACSTAGDICKYRGLKPGIVSFHIEHLVRRGLLTRGAVPGDRRKFALTCTPEAQPLIAQGRVMQAEFARQLTQGLGEEDMAHFCRCIAAFSRNIERIRRGEADKPENRPEEPK